MLSVLIEYIGLVLFGFTSSYVGLEVYSYIKYGYTVTGSEIMPQIRGDTNEWKRKRKTWIYDKWRI